MKAVLRIRNQGLEARVYGNSNWEMGDGRWIALEPIILAGT